MILIKSNMLCRSVVILALSILLTGCGNGPFSHHHSASFTDSLMMDTNAIAYYPYHVELYQLSNLPTQPYRVIDNFKVSIFNANGLKLQRAKLKTELQLEAAKLDADGVIELGIRDQFAYAEAIKFVPASKS